MKDYIESLFEQVEDPPARSRLLRIEDGSPSSMRISRETRAGGPILDWLKQKFDVVLHRFPGLRPRCGAARRAPRRAGAFFCYKNITEPNLYPVPKV